MSTLEMERNFYYKAATKSITGEITITLFYELSYHAMLDNRERKPWMLFSREKHFNFTLYVKFGKTCQRNLPSKTFDHILTSNIGFLHSLLTA